MAVYEVLTIALIITLAAATVAAIFLGLLNWIGALYVVRCTECHHLAFNSANSPRTSCPHPIHALHHPGARADVRLMGDRLHY